MLISSILFLLYYYITLCEVFIYLFYGHSILITSILLLLYYYITDFSISNIYILIF